MLLGESYFGMIADRDKFAMMNINCENKLFSGGMHMKKNWKRILAMLLAAAMTMNMNTGAVLADDAVSADAAAVDEVSDDMAVPETGMEVQAAGELNIGDVKPASVNGIYFDWESGSGSGSYDGENSVTISSGTVTVWGKPYDNNITVTITVSAGAVLIAGKDGHALSGNITNDNYKYIESYAEIKGEGSLKFAWNSEFKMRSVFSLSAADAGKYVIFDEGFEGDNQRWWKHFGTIDQAVSSDLFSDPYYIIHVHKITKREPTEVSFDHINGTASVVTESNVTFVSNSNDGSLQYKNYNDSISLSSDEYVHFGKEMIYEHNDGNGNGTWHSWLVPSQNAAPVTFAEGDVTAGGKSINVQAYNGKLGSKTYKYMVKKAGEAAPTKQEMFAYGQSDNLNKLVLSGNTALSGETQYSVYAMDVTGVTSKDSGTAFASEVVKLGDVKTTDYVSMNIALRVPDEVKNMKYCGDSTDFSLALKNTMSDSFSGAGGVTESAMNAADVRTVSINGSNIGKIKTYFISGNVASNDKIENFINSQSGNSFPEVINAVSFNDMVAGNYTAVSVFMPNDYDSFRAVCSNFVNISVSPAPLSFNAVPTNVTVPCVVSCNSLKKAVLKNYPMAVNNAYSGTAIATDAYDDRNKRYCIDGISFNDTDTFTQTGIYSISVSAGSVTVKPGYETKYTLDGASYPSHAVVVVSDDSAKLSIVSNGLSLYYGDGYGYDNDNQKVYSGTAPCTLTVDGKAVENEYVVYGIYTKMPGSSVDPSSLLTEEQAYNVPAGTTVYVSASYKGDYSNNKTIYSNALPVTVQQLPVRLYFRTGIAMLSSAVGEALTTSVSAADIGAVLLIRDHTSYYYKGEEYDNSAPVVSGIFSSVSFNFKYVDPSTAGTYYVNLYNKKYAAKYKETDGNQVSADNFKLDLEYADGFRIRYDVTEKDDGKLPVIWRLNYGGTTYTSENRIKNDYNGNFTIPASSITDKWGLDGFSLPENCRISGWTVYAVCSSKTDYGCSFSDQEYKNKLTNPVSFDYGVNANGRQMYIHSTEDTTKVVLDAVVERKASAYVNVSSIPDVTYDGRRHEPAAAGNKDWSKTNYDLALTVSDANTGKELVYGTDYTVSCKNNVNASAAVTDDRKRPQVLIKGRGNYSSISETVYFTINPAAAPSDTKFVGLKPVYSADRTGGFRYSYKFRVYGKVYDKDGNSKDEWTELKKNKDYTEQLQYLSCEEGYYRWTDDKPDNVTYCRLKLTGTGNYSGVLAEKQDNPNRTVETNPDGVKALDKRIKKPYPEDGIFEAVPAKAKAKQFSKLKISHLKSLKWTGKALTTDDLKIEVKKGSTSLAAETGYTADLYAYNADIDYIVPDEEFSEYALNAGTFYLRLSAADGAKALGYYGQTEYRKIRVVGQKLDKKWFTLDWTSKPYSGTASTNSVTVNTDTKAKVPSGFAMSDVTVSYEGVCNRNNADPGKYTVTVTGKGKYAGSSVKLSFTRKGMDMSKALKDGIITVSADAATVNAAGTTAHVKVTKNGVIYENVLADGAYGDELYNKADSSKTAVYVVKKWKSNTRYGKGTAVIAATDDISGTVNVTFDVLQKNVTEPLSSDAAPGSGNLYAAAGDIKKGSSAKPKVTVYQASEDGKTLKALKGSDYTFAADSEKKTVTVTFKGSYSGSGTVPFDIYDAKAKKLTVTVSEEDARRVYTGYGVTVTPVVKLDGSEITADRYAVSYENNVSCGTAAVIVTLKRGADGTYPYGGSAKAKFKIISQ